MLARAAAGLANHLLDGQPWLRERLLPFAGRTLEVRLPTAAFSLTVGSEGQLTPAVSSAQADAIATPDGSAALADLLAGRGLRRAIALTGDAAFAAALAGVIAELRWDAEEDLSRAIGDIAARRVVLAGEAALAWPRRVAGNLAAATAEYLSEEQRMLATRAGITDLMREIDGLRESVERLEQRIERLSRR